MEPTCAWKPPVPQLRQLRRSCLWYKRCPPAPASAASAAPVATQDGTPVDFNNLKEVKSPMVGVFYQAPSPEADPYVRVGSKVKKGDVLCVIEAMKLLNEITADTDGEIVDVCVENGQLVEYGQVLFKIF